MSDRVTQSMPLRVQFSAVSVFDHLTPASGKTIAITISKNGGAFINPSAGPTVATEVWPSAAPSVGVIVAGALGARTYSVVVTMTGPTGSETIVSPAAVAVIGANDLAVVTGPAAFAGMLGWNCYCDILGDGSRTKQNAGPIPFGTLLVEPVTGFTNTGAVASVIGLGLYYVDLTALDTATLGPFVVRGFEATIDTVDTSYVIAVPERAQIRPRNSAWVRGSRPTVQVKFYDSLDGLLDPPALVCKVLDNFENETVWTYGIDAALVRDAAGVYHARVLLDTTLPQGRYTVRFEAKDPAGVVLVAAETVLKTISDYCPVRAI
jgi:hypothetical protein